MHEGERVNRGKKATVASEEAEYSDISFDLQSVVCADIPRVPTSRIAVRVDWFELEVRSVCE